MSNYYNVLITLIYEPIINKFYPQLLKVAMKLPSDAIHPEFSLYPMEYKDDLYKILPAHLLEYSKIGDIEFIDEIITI